VVRAAAWPAAPSPVLSALSASTGSSSPARLLAGAFAGAVIPLTLVHIGDTGGVRQAPGGTGRFSALTSCASPSRLERRDGGVPGLVARHADRLAAPCCAIPVGLMFFMAADPGPPAGRRHAGEDLPGQFPACLRDRRAAGGLPGRIARGSPALGGATYCGGLRARGMGSTVCGRPADGPHGAWAHGQRAADGPHSAPPVRERAGAVRGVLMGIGYLLLIPRWPCRCSRQHADPGLGFAGLPHHATAARATELSPNLPRDGVRAFALQPVRGQSPWGPRRWGGSWTGILRGGVSGWPASGLNGDRFWTGASGNASAVSHSLSRRRRGGRADPSRVPLDARGVGRPSEAAQECAGDLGDRPGA